MTAGGDEQTLWRGDTLLGHLVPHHPVVDEDHRVVGTSGILRLAPTCPPLESVWQVSTGFQDSLHESLIGPVQYGANGPRRQAQSKAFAVLVAKPGNEQNRGVPVERLLTIRDANGTVLPTKSVMLQLIEVEDGVPINALHRARGLSDDARSIWTVTFSLRTR